MSSLPTENEKAHEEKMKAKADASREAWAAEQEAARARVEALDAAAQGDDDE